MYALLTLFFIALIPFLPSAGASPVTGFTIEADEFKRHCANKGVTLNTIEQAFKNCKPRPPMTESAIATAKAGAKQQKQQQKEAQKEHQKRKSTGNAAHAKSPTR